MEDSLNSDERYANLFYDLTCQLKAMKKADIIAKHNHTIGYSKEEKLWITRVDRDEGTYDGHSKKYKKLKAKTKEALENKLYEYYVSREECHPIRSVFNEWLEERMEFGEIQKSTRDRTITEFNRFFSSSDFDKIDISKITDYTLERFIKKSIHENELTPKRWANIKGILLSLFKFAKKKNYTTFHIKSFFDELVLPKQMFKRKIQEDEEEIFMDYEVQMIISWIFSSEERRNSLSNLGILLALTTGLRAGELAALKFSDFKGNMLRISRTEISYTENKQKVYEVREFTKGRDGFREIAVPNETLLILELIRLNSESDDFLFVKDGKRTKAEFFSKKLVRICNYLNIKPRSLHKIRKTYATILLDSGIVPEKVVIKQMGHTNISTTQGHYYYDRHKDDEKVVIISEVMKPITELLDLQTP